MSIEKKSLINNRAATKKANLTKVSATKVSSAKLSSPAAKAKLSTTLAAPRLGIQAKIMVVR